MGASDVVVIGAGAIGQSAALRLAQRGLSVTVVDPDMRRGASWAAAGMLAPVAEAAFGELPLLRANLASLELWASFAQELEDASGQSVGYRECGTVVVARDRDDVGELDRMLSYHHELGLQVERLRGSQLRKLEPALSTSVPVGLHCPSDHQVDNRALLGALEKACRRAGVERLFHRVRRVDVVGGRVRAVELDDGQRLEAGAVVLAAGAESSQVEGLPPEARPDVRPVKGQLLHLRVAAGHPPLIQRTVRGFGFYIVARADGRMVVGATVEERGWDRSVTVGGVFELLREAYEVLPGITECELVETVAGLRPGSPDNAPMIGATGVDGLVVATGHFRNGMLLAPLTAEGVACAIAGEPLPRVLGPLSLARFAHQEVGG